MPLYFNNPNVQNLIFQYKAAQLEEAENENAPSAQPLKDEILSHVKNIVNGIIFTHKFTAFEPYDDLMQEAMLACIVALERFNPEKGTAFNYFSLVAKKSLTYYTLRNRRNRNNYNIDDFSFYLHNQQELTDLDIETLIEQLRTYFIESKYKKLQALNDILEKYLKQKRRFNKRDFFKFSKSYGFSQNLIRKYLKIVCENKEEVYSLYG